MTADQKVSVTALRQQGYGYLKIANKLGITVGSVKSFCQRTERSAVPTADITLALTKPIENVPTTLVKPAEVTPIIPTPATESFCKGCGVPITQTAHKKQKIFCSTACRQKWWNEHLDLVERKAVYSFTCITCGKEFTAYGNKNRKYCCRDCYLTDRFGGRGA